MSLRVSNGTKTGNWNGTYKEGEKEWVRLYVGRSKCKPRLKGSVLANPFVLGKDGNRNEVLKLYDSWLESMLKYTASKQFLEIERIYKQSVEGNCNFDFVCHCFPQRCHADIIIWKVKTFPDYVRN